MSENTKAPEAKKLGKLEFTEEEVQYFQDFVDGSIKVAKSSKEIFKAEYKLYKANPTHPLKVKALSLRTISAITSDNNIIARVKKISKLAEQYTKHRVIAKFDELYFYNIEKIVSIFELLVNNDMTSLEKDLREIVKSAYNKEFSQTDYNNVVAEKLREFMKDNNMKDVDGEFVFADAFATITLLLEQMDIMQLQKISDAVAEAKKHPHEAIEMTSEIAEEGAEEEVA